MKIIITLILSTIAYDGLAGTTSQSMQAMLKKDEAVLIDVREKDEIQSGMLKGAKWFPMSKIDNNENWKKELSSITEGKKIFVYCRSGNRSGKLVNLLKQKGIESENIGGYEALKAKLPSQLDTNK
jgi:rhodanese-related sulfurtransferase